MRRLERGHWPRLIALACATLLAAQAGAARAVSAAGELRVCADPRNLPFSNARGEGFENRIAEHLGAALGLDVSYTFWPQRMGFIRNTLNAARCDVVIGVPATYDLVATTRPYYCSGYGVVFDPAREAAREPLNQARWRALRVGVVERTPPLALLRRADALRQASIYPVIYDYQDYRPGSIVEAVADGRLDLALLWGPRAGYFAQQASRSLSWVPLPAGDDDVQRFAIALGVRKGDDVLRDRLDRALVSEQSAVAAILDAYGVPRLPMASCDRAWRRLTAARRAEEGGTPVHKVAQRTSAAESDTTADEHPAETTEGAAANATDTVGDAKPYRAENGRLGPEAYTGWTRYAAFCARCHGTGGIGSAAGPNLVERLERLDKAAFEQVVTHGKKGNFGVMPPWDGNPNVMPYLDQLWAYLSARRDGAVGPGRPEKLDAAQASKTEP